MSALPPPNVIKLLAATNFFSALSGALFFGCFKFGVMRWSVLTRDFPQNDTQDDGDRKNDQRVNVEIVQEFHDSLQLLLNIGQVRAALAAEVGRLSTSFKRTLFPTQTFVKFPVRGQA